MWIIYSLRMEGREGGVGAQLGSGGAPLVARRSGATRRGSTSSSSLSVTTATYPYLPPFTATAVFWHWSLQCIQISIWLNIYILAVSSVCEYEGCAYEIFILVKNGRFNFGQQASVHLNFVDSTHSTPQVLHHKDISSCFHLKRLSFEFNTP